MRPIIYRIIDPFGLLVVYSGIGVIVCCFGLKKLKKRKIRNATVFKIKQLRAWLIFLLCLLLIGIVIFAYYSLDLIYTDYIEAEVIYTHCGNDKSPHFSIVCFSTDSTQINCAILTSDLREYQFIEGATYEIIYAKRTAVLLDAEIVRGTD